ncbi:MAG: twin-arginine translocase subunit TatC [Clostridiales bacterium]|nr:twin-arginine translocase subunit TatC [Clostridiales bacterium]
MKFGTTELLIILAILILIFGPSQIPKLAGMFGKDKKNTGKSQSSDKKATDDKKIDFSKWLDEEPSSTYTSVRVRELLSRVAICIFCAVIAFAIALFFSQNIISFLNTMAASYGYELASVTPQQLLRQQYSISFAISGCISLPIIIYHIWAFSQPDLKRKKKLVFLAVILSDLACFVIGILFTYELILPFMLQLLA